MGNSELTSVFLRPFMFIRVHEQFEEYREK